MRSYHQLSILVLHQGGDSVDPCAKDRWPLGGQFAGSFLLLLGQQPLLCLLLRLWTVLVCFKKLAYAIAPGDTEGQGMLVCCSSWGHKESDTTEQLN